MGSLFGGAKAPKVQPVRYVPLAPVTTETDEEEDQEKTPQEITAELRRDNLLRRSRGRIGTIYTGFHGLYGRNEAGESDKKKTLLGE
jgi:hypothetical protein